MVPSGQGAKDTVVVSLNLSFSLPSGECRVVEIQNVKRMLLAAKTLALPSCTYLGFWNS